MESNINVNKLSEIELNYDIEKIKIKNLNIWPLIRITFENILEFNLNNKNNYLNNIIDKFKKTKNIFFGIKNIIKKKYEYILFTDILEKRFLYGKIIDKIAQGIIDEIGSDKILIIENPVNNFHYPIKRYKSQNITSLVFFQILEKLIEKFNTKKIKIEKDAEIILQKILREYKINIDYKKIINQFYSYLRIYELFFKKIKPKAIFLNCYYSIPNMAAIYAAKKFKIKTIELQHGIINNKHSAYNIPKDLGKNLFPDYLFVFGDYFKKFFNYKNFFINESNVYSVGYYYIEKIKEENNNNLKEILEIKNSLKLNKIIVISSQISVEEYLLKFLLNVSNNDNNNLYIFRPRYLSQKFEIKNKPKNFYLSLKEEEDIYRLLKISDIHSTVYSSVCFESLFFGVPNVMINYNNFSKIYFGDMLNNEKHTVYVDSEDEFINVVNSWQFMDKNDIIKESKNYIKPNHKLMVSQAIDNILYN